MAAANGKNKNKLTPKQRMFVKEYLVDLNATQAAIRAGYSKRTASEQSARLLANVKIQKHLQTDIKKRGERVEIKADSVLKELGNVVFFDPRRIYDENGNLKHIKDMDEDVAKAITSHKVIKVESDEKATYTTIEIKWADKLRAVELSMKHLGMLNEKVDVEHSGDIDINVTLKGLDDD